MGKSSWVAKLKRCRTKFCSKFTVGVRTLAHTLAYNVGPSPLPAQVHAFHLFDTAGADRAERKNSNSHYVLRSEGGGGRWGQHNILAFSAFFLTIFPLKTMLSFMAVFVCVCCMCACLHWSVRICLCVFLFAWGCQLTRFFFHRFHSLENKRHILAFKYSHMSLVLCRQ